MRLLFAAMALVTTALPICAQDPVDKPVALTPEARDEAIVRAMRYLDDHLWSLGNEQGSPRKQYAIAVTGWAYLLAGDKARGEKKLPGRGKQLSRIRKYLNRYASLVAAGYGLQDKKKGRKARKKDPEPEPPPGRGFPRGPCQYNWPLSIAAHFFAESAVRGRKAGSSRKALKSIVRVLEATQQPNGGWGHDDAARPGLGPPPITIPKPGGTVTLTYPHTLLAASHCALSGLGVAHRLFKTRQAKSLARGRTYFEKAQNANGTFPYDPGQKHGVKSNSAMAGGIEVARTGGAVFALLCAGANPQDPAILAALKAVDERPELLSEGHGSASMALQFGALLSRARGPEAWNRFRQIFLPRILSSQEEDGSFLCVCKQASPGVTCDTKKIPGADWPGYIEGKQAYVTAINTLILVLDRATIKAIPEMPKMRAPQTPSPKRM